jgi:hypothetical protein
MATDILWKPSELYMGLLAFALPNEEEEKPPQNIPTNEPPAQNQPLEEETHER